MKISEHKKEYNKKWHEENKDYIKKFRKRYHAKNRERVLQKMVEWRNSIKKKVYDHYGWKCNCCGETNPFFLSIDHINNDGYKDKTSSINIYSRIIKQGFPDTYQTLCMNCNHGKYRNKGICPHQMIR